MYETPDLSKEFNPVPKVYKTKVSKSKGLGPGKKTIASKDAVTLLKEIFAKWGITTCEWDHSKCWKNNALTFAHVDKRRNLTPEDVKSPNKVVLLCTPGHMVVEQMPREQMRKLLEKIIAEREQNLGA